MRKIPTMFERVFENHKVVSTIEKFTDPSFEKVLKTGIPTIKFDGACCAIIDGIFYKRYDAKKGKPVPENAIKCQEEADPITGHLPCWVPVDKDNPSDKWFIEAFRYSFGNTPDIHNLAPDYGTYEAIGPHFQGNPYKLDTDLLIQHGSAMIIDLDRSFPGIKNWLENYNVEGIVFWDEVMTSPICKIKRSDFGLPWPVRAEDKNEI